MKSKIIFIIISVAILFMVYYFCSVRNKFAQKIYPKLTQYTLLKPVGSNKDDDDEKIIYYINNLYKYDSIDFVILKEILKSRSIEYVITMDNEILILSDDITSIESLFFIENIRLDKRSQIHK